MPSRSRRSCPFIVALLGTLCLQIFALPGERGQLLLAGPARAEIAANKGAPVADIPDAIPDEIIVRFKPGSADAAMMNMHATQGISVKGIRRAVHSDWVLLKIDGNLKLKDAVMAWRKNPNVLFAEPNYRIYADTPPLVPNDPDFDIQWFGYWKTCSSLVEEACRQDFVVIPDVCLSPPCLDAVMGSLEKTGRREASPLLSLVDVTSGRQEVPKITARPCGERHAVIDINNPGVDRAP